MPCFGELMNQNLLMLFVFLRFHSFEIDPLSVNVTLQFLLVAGNPEFAHVVEGEDVVEAVLLALAAEIELVAAFIDVPFYHIGESMDNVVTI